MREFGEFGEEQSARSLAGGEERTVDQGKKSFGVVALDFGVAMPEVDHVLQRVYSRFHAAF